MPLSLEDVSRLAPDTASVAAARKLMTPKKWFDHGRDEAVIWSHCQGSGKNPYYVVAQDDGLGYKCSCPSRKFPCKHVLAVLMQNATSPDLFGQAEKPDWVEAFVNRKTQAQKAKATKAANAGKPVQKSQTREKTAQSAAQACGELISWIEDRLRLGLDGLLRDGKPFEDIAARLNDAKAQALGARVAAIPLLLKEVPDTVRFDALLMEMGRLVILARVFQSNPLDDRLMGEVLPVVSQADLLVHEKALIVEGRWMSLGYDARSLPGGFMAVTTYVASLDKPGIVGELRQSVKVGQALRPAFATGMRFDGKATFYPSLYPLRAMMEGVCTCDDVRVPALGEGLAHWLTVSRHVPWVRQAPVCLSAGRFVFVKRKKDTVHWYRTTDGKMYPIAAACVPSAVVLGCNIEKMIGLWDGQVLRPTWVLSEQMGEVAL